MMNTGFQMIAVTNQELMMIFIIRWLSAMTAAGIANTGARHNLNKLNA